MEQHGNEFAVVVEDIRLLTQDEGDSLTILWVLEGQAELQTAAGRETVSNNGLAVINRYQRWRFSSQSANVTLRVVLSGRWVIKLYNDFFAHDYAVPTESGGNWPQCDELRHLLRQLLVVTLVNDPHRFRLEANRWLSEILLLLIGRYKKKTSH